MVSFLWCVTAERIAGSSCVSHSVQWETWDNTKPAGPKAPFDPLCASAVLFHVQSSGHVSPLHIMFIKLYFSETKQRATHTRSFDLFYVKVRLLSEHYFHAVCYKNQPS